MPDPSGLLRAMFHFLYSNLSRILLSTFGSFGDLYPFLALGAELRKRGHAVLLATSESYRSKIEAEGLQFHAVRPDVSMEDREMLAYVMDAKRGTERIVRYLASIVRDSYHDVSAPAAEADLIVTHPITYGTVLAARKLRKPWASTVLAPISFFSPHDPPMVSPAPWLHRVSMWGTGFAKLWMEPSKRHTLRWIRPIVQLEKELSLSSNGNPLFEGQHSPSLVLALFSRHFGPPQVDWPSSTVTAGFPFFEDRCAMPEELERFLNAGPAPVVFTLGSSAVGAARNFYTDSLRAVERLGVRAVLLTGSHPQGLPDRLPDSVIAVPYAPHAQVFARASAIVHQGGVGTTAQALRSGHPMLVVPFAHDQYDNGERIHRLGVGEWLAEPKYTSDRVEPLLARILTNVSYSQSALAFAKSIRDENGCAAAADAMDRLLNSCRA
ncbi:MAG: nucleotide disphospho-sugar-binding domain-containing protein [Bryobacteraceae bacterium]